MIKFFKINDPYRLVALGIVFFAIRGAFLFFDLDFTLPELRYFLAAKAMMQGKWLYRDIWETTEPLTTIAYAILPASNNSFKITAYVLNVILLLLNSIYVNYILQKFDIHSTKSHLPAFFYLFLSLTVFELNTLSAPFLASTFLLYVVNSMLAYLKKEDLKRLFDASFFLGICCLFYLPSISFIFVILITVVVYTREIGKSFLLLILGLCMPWMVVSIIFLWSDSLFDFYRIFIGNYFSNFKSLIKYNETWVLLLPPLLTFGTIIFYSINTSIREINYQSICRRFIFVWLIGGIFVFLISPLQSFAILHILLFPFTFFFTFYVLNIRNTLFVNIVLFCSIVIMIGFQTRMYQGISMINNMISLTVKEVNEPKIKEKNIWVAGDSCSYYLNSKIATKYLNWEVSKLDFDNTKEFAAIESIRKSFDQDMPEIIIDQNNIMPKVFNRIPTLGAKYQLTKKGMYTLSKK